MFLPFAKQQAVPGLVGLVHSGGPMKVVWHKTQGDSYAGAFAAFRQNKSAPNITIGEDGVVHQHIDTSRGSYSLENHPGGVETNRDGAIQIEVVGWVGKTMSPAQLRSCVLVAAVLGQEHHIPAVWPAGRPRGAMDPRGAVVWDTVGGHYGHSQVPENSHTDPGWTDAEWAALSFTATPVKELAPMFDPPLSIVAWTLIPGGAAAVGPDGGIFCEPPTLYVGGPQGKPYWAGHKPADIVSGDERTPDESLAGRTYVVIDTQGLRYAYGPTA